MRRWGATEEKGQKKDVAPLTASADSFKSAIQSASDLRLEIPPVVEKAKKVFILDDFMEKGEYEKLVIAMG